MAEDLFNIIKDFREKNIEMAQEIQLLRQNNTQKDREKMELTKENNVLRLKFSRLKHTFMSLSSKLDKDMDNSEKEAINHIVQASGHISRSMELRKIYMQQVNDELNVLPSRSDSNSPRRVGRIAPQSFIRNTQARSTNQDNPQRDRDRRQFQLFAGSANQDNPQRDRERMPYYQLLQDPYIPLPRLELANLVQHGLAEPEDALHDDDLHDDERLHYSDEDVTMPDENDQIEGTAMEDRDEMGESISVGSDSEMEQTVHLEPVIEERTLALSPSSPSYDICLYMPDSDTDPNQIQPQDRGRDASGNEVEENVGRSVSPVMGVPIRARRANMRANDTATTSRDTATTSCDTATTSRDTATIAHDTATIAHDTATTSHDTATTSHDTATTSHDTATTSHDTATISHDTSTVTQTTTGRVLHVEPDTPPCAFTPTVRRRRANVPVRGQHTPPRPSTARARARATPGPRSPRLQRDDSPVVVLSRLSTNEILTAERRSAILTVPTSRVQKARSRGPADTPIVVCNNMSTPKSPETTPLRGFHTNDETPIHAPSGSSVRSSRRSKRNKSVSRCSCCDSPAKHARQPNTTQGQANATPGQANTTPVQDNNTPGQANTTPVQDNNTPGQANTTPVQDNSTPGQANTTPGQDKNTPGQANTTSGKNNNTPGQANTTSGHENNTPEQDNDNVQVKNSLKRAMKRRASVFHVERQDSDDEASTVQYVTTVLIHDNGNNDLSNIQRQVNGSRKRITKRRSTVCYPIQLDDDEIVQENDVAQKNGKKRTQSKNRKNAKKVPQRRGAATDTNDPASTSRSRQGPPPKSRAGSRSASYRDSDSDNSNMSDMDDRRRRPKKPVTYTEIPLNRKMRR